MYDLSCLTGDDNHSSVLNIIVIVSGIVCYMRFWSFDLLVCNVFVLDGPIILSGLGPIILSGLGPIILSIVFSVQDYVFIDFLCLGVCVGCFFCSGLFVY